MRRRANEHGKEVGWISLYFIINLSLTIHNKWVLSRLHFNFPWILTAIHISMSGCGSFLLDKYWFRRDRESALRWEAHAKLLLFSVLYATNIAFSNLSLAFVTLAFHQVMRSSGPAVTVLMEYAMFGKRQPFWTCASLVPVMAGICMATADGLYSTHVQVVGLLLTTLGVVLSAVKGIATNVLMVGPLKLDPIEVIWRMAIPAVVQCLLFGYYFGEMGRVATYFSALEDFGLVGAVVLKVVLNGSLAFLLNWVSFSANRHTSALSMTVAGNVKQALSIVLSIHIFDTGITVLNGMGIVCTILGGSWYSMLSYRQKQRDEVGGRVPLSDGNRAVV